jgi:hypothetical protein
MDGIQRGTTARVNARNCCVEKVMSRMAASEEGARSTHRGTIVESERMQEHIR